VPHQPKETEMAKFEFNRDHARKLVEAIYPDEIPQRCCDEPCHVCDEMETEWAAKVETYYKALKSLEGGI
jgi:hypothetical protein